MELLHGIWSYCGFESITVIQHSIRLGVWPQNILNTYLQLWLQVLFVSCMLLREKKSPYSASAEKLSSSEVCGKHSSHLESKSEAF